MQKKDLSILIGNGLDHFDTALYSFIAPILSNIFFPNNDPIISLILTYSTLATSIIARPIGAMIFSVIAKNYGANIALSYSLIGVAITTMFIGCLPTHSMVGWLSPLMLIIVLMIQNMFAEGESAIAKLYILDNKIQTQALKSSYLYQLSTMLGIIIASFVSAILTNSNHQEYWRLCFIFGGSIGIIGLYLRRYSTIFQQEMTKPLKLPTKLINSVNLINDNKLKIFRGSIVIGFSYMTYTLPFILMNSLVPMVTSISLGSMMAFNTILLIIDAIMIPIIGYLIKKYNPASIMTKAAQILFISIIPLWLYMDGASLLYIHFLRLWIVILGVIFLCPLNLWFNNLFAGSDDKYLLTSIANALGTSLLGRLVPLICTSLWYFTDSLFPIGLYIAMISLATIMAVKNH
jgi:MFS family permease